MGKRERREANRARARAKQANQSNDREQRIAAHAARNNDKKGVHPKFPLVQNYTNPELQRFLRECEDESLLTKKTAISQRGKESCQHVYVYDLIQRPNIRRMLCCVLACCKQRSDAPVFRSLDDIVTFFNSCNIDLLPFFDGDAEELQQRYDTDVRHCLGGHSTFLKRMMVYTMRSEQFSCGDCDKPFNGKRYGAENAEANHVFDDTAKEESERRKSFNVSADNFDCDVCDLLFELMKIDEECVYCHNKFGAANYKELHPICVGQYDWLANCPVRLPFEVEQTTEFRRVRCCIETLSKNPSSLSFEDVYNGFENSTDFFAKDCFYFTKNQWDSADSETRKQMLHRVVITVQKRMCKECLQCGEQFWNRPGRELVGEDLHHILWDSKLFNPSEGAKKSIVESLGENRKCGQLCRGCHLKIHHKPGENERFVAMLGSNGYVIDSVTGEMSRRSPLAML